MGEWGIVNGKSEMGEWFMENRSWGTWRPGDGPDERRLLTTLPGLPGLPGLYGPVCADWAERGPRCQVQRIEQLYLRSWLDNCIPRG